jgi:hypothetical protein
VNENENENEKYTEFLLTNKGANHLWKKKKNMSERDGQNTRKKIEYVRETQNSNWISQLWLSQRKRSTTIEKANSQSIYQSN